MTMYPPERQRAITDLLIQHDGRRASVSQISEQLKVTTETVRRDLDVLERRGVLRRIRGGAELLDSIPFEQALAARHAEQFEDKLTIARRVAEELPEDGVVVLDSGSLTLVCAQAMPKDRALAVVTIRRNSGCSSGAPPVTSSVAMPASRRTSRQASTMSGAIVSVRSGPASTWQWRQV